MKKRFFKVAFVAMFAVAVGYSAQQAKSNSGLSDLVLDNVEALAGSESAGFNCRWTFPGSWDWCIPYGYGLGCPCYM